MLHEATRRHTHGLMGSLGAPRNLVGYGVHGRARALHIRHETLSDMESARRNRARGLRSLKSAPGNPEAFSCPTPHGIDGAETRGTPASLGHTVSGTRPIILDALNTLLDALDTLFHSTP